MSENIESKLDSGMELALRLLVTGQKALVVNKIPLSLHSGLQGIFSTY